MSDRPCSEWAPDGLCVVRARQYEPERAKLCEYFDRCMYAAERSDFTPLEREYLDAWSHGQLCLLVYRPGGNPPPHQQTNR